MSDKLDKLRQKRDKAERYLRKATNDEKALAHEMARLTRAERTLLTESLPNTHIEFDHGFTTGGGWRELQNYFDMRDLMGLPHNAW